MEIAWKITRNEISPSRRNTKLLYVSLARYIRNIFYSSVYTRVLLRITPKAASKIISFTTERQTRRDVEEKRRTFDLHVRRVKRWSGNSSCKFAVVPIKAYSYRPWSRIMVENPGIEDLVNYSWCI